MLCGKLIWNVFYYIIIFFNFTGIKTASSIWAVFPRRRVAGWRWHVGGLRYWEIPLTITNLWHAIANLRLFSAGTHLNKGSRLKIRLNTFRRSTITQKQLIITIIIIIIVVDVYDCKNFIIHPKNFFSEFYGGMFLITY